jgi:hypothetical protein
MDKPTNRSFHLVPPLLAACAVLAGCADGVKTQVITGQLSSDGALAVRAVDDQSVVTAAQVRSNGAFTLALPSGGRYRIEILTTSGVKHLYARGGAGLRDLSFKVCKPDAPWDVGAVKPPGAGGGSTCDPKQDPSCKCDPYGKCTGGGSGACDPAKDPTCKCDPTGKCTGGGGGSGGGGGTCDPAKDPSCKCDPTGKCTGGGGSGGGGGGPCDPAKDPDCKCDPYGKCTGGGGGSGGGGGTCDPAKDPSCKPNCNDPSDKKCSPPPPAPCKDPKDPSTCKDECEYEPSSCGCPSSDPKCWGEPCKPTCDATGNCSGDDALTPDRPPVDFGCKELN